MEGCKHRSICDNCRGISLLSVAGKVLAKIMPSRVITTTADNLLPESNLRTWSLPHANNNNMPTTTSPCDLLWKVLLQYSCPRKFINILRQFQDGMTAKVVIRGQESDPFTVGSGMRQGCVLAPVLFNIFILCVTTLLHQDIEDDSGVTLDFRLDGRLFNIRRLQATTKLRSICILKLQYADDCAFVAHSPGDLQAILTAAVRAYKRMGLSVNIPKTEVQWSSAPPQNPPAFSISDTPLTIVPHFKCLGSILSENCSIDQDVQNRIKQFHLHLGGWEKGSSVTTTSTYTQQ